MVKELRRQLCSEQINIAAAAVVTFLESVKVNREDVIRSRLIVEETLSQWMEQQVSDKFSLRMGVRLKKPYLELEAAGRRCNIFEQEESSLLLGTILESLGRKPSYSYKNGRNSLLLCFPVLQRNFIDRMLIAVTMAVVIGSLCNLFLPETVCSVVLSRILEPVYATAFRLLGLISGPLIFFTVIWGIYGIGDTVTLGTVGKKLIIRFIALMFVIVLLAILSAVPILGINVVGGGTVSSAFDDILEMILDIIPANVIAPLISGNTMQIIFLASIMGVAMLFLGKRATGLADVVGQLNELVQFVMAFVSGLLPGMLFIIFLRLVLSHALLVFASVWQVVLLIACGCLVTSAIFTLATAMRFHVSPFLILRKALTTFVVAFSTSSSAAAFPYAMEICEKKFGVDKSLCSFGLPLGMVIFMPGSVFHSIVAALFFTAEFEMSVSPAWLISLWLIGTLLLIAAPPVPGGGIAVLTMLYTKMGLPIDALAVALSIDFIFDIISTATNMYTLQLELIHAAGATGKLERDVLCDKEEPSKSMSADA